MKRTILLKEEFKKNLLLTFPERRDLSCHSGPQEEHLPGQEAEAGMAGEVKPRLWLFIGVPKRTERHGRVSLGLTSSNISRFRL